MDKDKFRFSLVISLLSLFGMISLSFVISALFFRPTPPIAAIHTDMAERGQILDRNGEVLAIQTRKKNLTIWKPNLQDIDDTASILAEIFHRDKEQLVKKLKDGADYQKLFRKMEIRESEQVKLMIDSGRLRGVYLEDTLDRFYPLDSLASHIVGFTNIENEGKSGIEQSMNRYLFPSSKEFNAGHGNNVYLTIDQNLQYYTEQIAEKAYRENDAESVIFIAVNAKTGEILSTAARPTYNPNELNNSTPETRSNILARYSYEPGSVFKIFSLGAALDSGLIDEQTLFYCDGKYEINPPEGKKITIKCLGHHGYQNYSDVIKNSCNAGMAAAVEPMDNFNFYQALRDFGFAEPVGIELPYENPGLIRKPKKWSIRTKPTVAIGQEILTTALQLTSAATVYTNEGKLLQLRLIDRIERPDGSLLKQYYKTPIRQVVSRKTSDLILKAMEQNTLDGTGKRAMVKGINISTKTGTAQMIDKETRKYSDKVFFASCLAILPTDNPQIILYGGINYPKGKSNYGGVIVTPLIRELAIESIYQLKMGLEGDGVISSSGKIRRAHSSFIEIGDKMPALTGYSKRDLLQLYQNKEIDVVILGSGRVVKQQPAPGEPVVLNCKVILELE